MAGQRRASRASSSPTAKPFSSLFTLTFSVRPSSLLLVSFSWTDLPDGLQVLDHSSQVWWRWMNIFFTLVLWALELLVSNEDDPMSEKWKVD
jgi:hypothetical protein